MTDRIEQPYKPDTFTGLLAAAFVFVMAMVSLAMFHLMPLPIAASFALIIVVLAFFVVRAEARDKREYRRLSPIWEAQQQADRIELSRREDVIADRGLVTIETQWCPPGEDDWYDDEAEAQGHAGKDVALLSRSRLVTAYSAPPKTLAPGATVQVLQARFEVIGGTLEINSRQGDQVTPYGLVDDVRDAWNYLHVPGGERTQLDHKVHLILPT